jgi:quercetin dioxygenase-like cupin family protein
MTRRILAPLLTFALGAVVGRFLLTGTHLPFAAEDVVKAQAQKSVTMVHLYTGPDNQTHAEEIQAPLTDGVFKMLPVTGAELHSSSPGLVLSWHPAPRRQYVITLSGHGEIEVADGKKIPIKPGQIDFVEDTTGKGHMTRMTGTEDRVAVWLPIADDAPPSAPKK